MIKIAETDDEIQSCCAVMTELRPHLAPQEFVARIRKLMDNFGYRLVYLYDERVVAVGGIRIAEWLAGGRYLEIEDLVTGSGAQSKGYGGQLFDWIVEYAGHHDCDQVRLVSSVKRFGAHRFYLRKRMDIEAHYFSLKLK